MIDEIGMLRSVYLTPSELTARVPEVGPQPYVGNCGAREAESRQAGHTSKQSDLLRNNLLLGNVLMTNHDTAVCQSSCLSDLTAVYNLISLSEMPIANSYPSRSNPMSTKVVLGSMSRADEYQQILTGLKESAGGHEKVQGEMVDRVLDNGKSASPMLFSIGPH